MGGPQWRVLQVASRLKDTDIEQVVVIPRRGSENFQVHLRAAGVQTYLAGLHRPSQRPGELALSALFLIPEVFSLVRWLRRERIDVVHCNGVWQVHALLAGKLARCRTLLHLNDTWTTSWMRTVFYALAPLADGFILAAERVRDAYFTGRGRKFLRKPVFNVPAPVDTARFDPSDTAPALDLKADGELLIVTVGNLNPLKGLEHFIQMADKVNKSIQIRVKFAIIGAELETQREYAHKLRSQVDALGLSNVPFTGPRDDMPEVLKAADIYVCSSIREASPMAVWEAMSMALPVVATDVGDIPCFVRHGESGMVVETGDWVALAEAVTGLIQDPEKRRALGEEARRVAETELSIESCVERHAHAYQAIAGL